MGEDEGELMVQALPVADMRDYSGDKFQHPPSSAEEYLLWVKLEAEELPDVMVATSKSWDPTEDKAKAYLPNGDGFAASDPDLLPDPQWERDFVSGFVDLRHKMLRLASLRPPDAAKIAVPPLRDSAGWLKFSFGEDSAGNGAVAGDSGAGSEGHELQGTPPILRLLLQFDQICVRALLKHHIGWLDAAQELTLSRAVWLFACLAHLDKPVDLDVAAILRQLLRRLCYLRAQLKGGAADAALPQLNTLIAIVGCVFDQRGEPVEVGEDA